MKHGFSRRPYGTYPERCREYLELAADVTCAPIPPGGEPHSHRTVESQRVAGWSATGFLPQLARLELDRSPDPRPLLDAVDYVSAGLDCQDFALAGLLRLLYRYRESDHLDADLRQSIERCVLGAAYWCDEPGESPAVCWHTENHQGLYHSCELLAGLLFPDARFAHSGMTGREHRGKARDLLEHWLRWREQFGWCEWLSNTYYCEDVITLCNLLDFAADADLRRRASGLLDGLLLEVAMHSFRGVMGCPHGRTYAPNILDTAHDSISAICRLISGMGHFRALRCPGAIALCTSSYRLPRAIEAVAREVESEMEILQRSGVRVEDAPAHGLRYDSEDDNRFFAGLQAMYHPRIVATSQAVQERCGFYWDDPDFAGYRRLLEEQDGNWVATGFDRYYLAEANVRTWKTSSYALSSVQDFRPGGHGFQEHLWQATLDERTVVFTNCPRSDDMESGVPTMWASNGVLPRIGQVQNVLIAHHRVPAGHWFAGSHAYVPREQFDEWRLEGCWLLARKRDAFLALWSAHGARWEEVRREGWTGWDLRADAPDNPWVCELGHSGRWPSFDAFCRAVLAARCDYTDGVTTYSSPSLGTVKMGWEGPLTLEGRPVAMRFKPRYQAPFLASDEHGHLLIEKGSHRHSLCLPV